MRYRGNLIGLRPFQIARLGIGYVPETRDVFPTLTVRENLLLGETKGSRFTLGNAYRLFAARACGREGGCAVRRRAADAVARAHADGRSVARPDRRTGRRACAASARASRGAAMLLIEERLTIARMFDARVVVMGHGAIRFDGSLAVLDGSEAVKRE